MALKADRCEILKDVDGIFTADPRVVPGARKLDTISYEEIMELARAGSQVLHPRASELGEAYGMPIVVGSSFHEAPGTTIVRGEQMPLEGRQRVRAIAHETDVGRITIVGVPDRPGIAYAVFHPLEDAAINVDVIVQNVSHDNVTDISFTVGRADLTRALRLVQPVAEEMGAREVTSSGQAGQDQRRRLRPRGEPGLRRADVRHPRRGGDQHRLHHHQRDPHHLPDRRVPGRRGGAGLASRVPAGGMSPVSPLPGLAGAPRATRQ